MDGPQQNVSVESRLPSVKHLEISADNVVTSMLFLEAGRFTGGAHVSASGPAMARTLLSCFQHSGYGRLKDDPDEA
jgi:hypothetical protein